MLKSEHPSVSTADAFQPTTAELSPPNFLGVGHGEIFPRDRTDCRIFGTGHADLVQWPPNRVIRTGAQAGLSQDIERCGNRSANRLFVCA